MDTTLSSYALSSALNDYALASSLSDYALASSLNSYTTTANLPAAIRAVLANYDISLQKPEVSYTIDNTTGIVATVTKLAGSTYTYQVYLNDTLTPETETPQPVGDSITIAGPLTMDDVYKIKVYRYYGDDNSNKEITITVE